MAILFLDSSALVKRYVPETGSAWIKAMTDPIIGNRLYVARITGAEVVAAVTRRQRRGDITLRDRNLVLADFRRDFPAAFSVIEITVRVITDAMALAEKQNGGTVNRYQRGAGGELLSRSGFGPGAETPQMDGQGNMRQSLDNGVCSNYITGGLLTHRLTIHHAVVRISPCTGDYLHNPCWMP